METLCPSVQSSGEAARDELTVGGILAPAATGIVRAAWPPKAGNG